MINMYELVQVSFHTSVDQSWDISAKLFCLSTAVAMFFYAQFVGEDIVYTVLQLRSSTLYYLDIILRAVLNKSKPERTTCFDFIWVLEACKVS